MSGKAVSTTYRTWSLRRWSIAPTRWLQPSIVLALLAGVGLSALSGLSEGAIAAEPLTAGSSNPSLAPDTEALDVKALQPGNAPEYLVTATTISLTHLTIPSLWWLQEQIADKDPYGGNLLENWLAYPNSGNRPGRVDLVVNRQFWSLLDYLDRYAFIHAFGEVARDYGYNVRVFDGQAALVGASTCDFNGVDVSALQSRRFASSHNTTAVSTSAQSIACSILLDSRGKLGLRGGFNQLPGAGSAKALDIGQP